MQILRQRITDGATGDFVNAAAVGLVQGKLIDMICAADIAEKLVDVTVRDVRGSCPQNMILLAICIVPADGDFIIRISMPSS